MGEVKARDSAEKKRGDLAKAGFKPIQLPFDVRIGKLSVAGRAVLLEELGEGHVVEGVEAGAEGLVLVLEGIDVRREVEGGEVPPRLPGEELDLAALDRYLRANLGERNLDMRRIRLE